MEKEKGRRMEKGERLEDTRSGIKLGYEDKLPRLEDER